MLLSPALATSWLSAGENSTVFHHHCHVQGALVLVAKLASRRLQQERYRKKQVFKLHRNHTPY